MCKTPRDSETCREDLTAYLDGELSLEREAVVRERLREDPELAREAEQLDGAWRLLDHLPRPTASASFVDQTMARIELTDRRLTRRRRVRWLTGVASMAAAVLLGVVLLRPATPEPSTALLQNLETVEVIHEQLKLAQADQKPISPDRIAAELEFVEALDALGVFREETTN